MAAAGWGTTAPVNGDAPGRSLEDTLFEEGYAFDFFQAVRLLEKLFPERRAVGRWGPPRAEVARFRSLVSLSFPASSIYEVERRPREAPPLVTVTFLGLAGFNGVLPTHYAELVLRLERETKGPERRAFRDWLDLFNHRLTALFFRAWEKYRFSIPYERGEYALADPDPFTRGLYSLIGLGTPQLRGRLRVAVREGTEEEPRERTLGRIEDLSLLYYGGLIGHRPRCVVSLVALLRDYFQLPVLLRQFHGQWLRLEPSNQSRLGEGGWNYELGVNTVAGERVWDVQSKFRLRLGPLRFAQFNEFLPDRAPLMERKALFLLSHLVRLYVGPELDFDVQLVLRAAEVPECRLAEGAPIGALLGWNTWLRSLQFPHDADDAVFEGEELVWLNQGAAKMDTPGKFPDQPEVQTKEASLAGVADG
jgi:type VI secretion system protein ImpH